MDLPLKIALLLALVALCCVAPGFALLKRLRWSPLEKLVGAVAASLTMLYLVSFGLYLIKAPAWGYWCVSAVCAFLAAWNAKALWRLLAARQVRRALAGLGVLLALLLLLLASVRHYGGGGWMGDWVEHLQRTVFWMDHLPTHLTDPQGNAVPLPIYPNYALPARPPMMNIVAGFFMVQAGDDFELFQVVMTALNTLVALPCMLIARTFARRGSRVLPVVALLAACPLLAQNATFTWTKLLCAFFVIYAIWLYLAAWRKGDTLRMAAAFAAMSAGMLVHYSAGPFLVFMTGHYVLALWWRRRHRWREALVAAGAAALLLATWAAWSLAVYGPKLTLASNTALTPSIQVKESPLEKLWLNVRDTLVPHPLRGAMQEPANTAFFAQKSELGYARDYLFLMYQSNLIVAVGAISGIVLLVLMARAVPAAAGGPKGQARSLRRFWLALAIVCTLGGIAVHGERDQFGVTHVTLQPLVLLGVTAVAAWLPSLPAALRWLVLVGCLADFGMGAALQFWMQGKDNDSPEKPVFRFEPGVVRTDHGPAFTFARETELSGSAFGNWLAKNRQALLARHVRELAQHNSPVAAALRVRVQAALDNARMEDRALFGGYFSRHGDKLSFLGDSLGKWVVVPLGAACALTAGMLLATGALGGVRRSARASRGGGAPKAASESRQSTT
jgi:4-amino-4-deoxy-L-arabinose transferase-like glycosyltransferase